MPVSENGNEVIKLAQALVIKSRNSFLSVDPLFDCCSQVNDCISLCETRSQRTLNPFDSELEINNSQRIMLLNYCTTYLKPMDRLVKRCVKIAHQPMGSLPRNHEMLLRYFQSIINYFCTTHSSLAFSFSSKVGPDKAKVIRR